MAFPPGPGGAALVTRVWRFRGRRLVGLISRLPCQDVTLLSFAAALVDHGKDLVEAVGYLIHQGVALANQLATAAVPTRKGLAQIARDTCPLTHLLRQVDCRPKIQFAQRRVDCPVGPRRRLLGMRRAEIVMVLVHDDGWWVCSGLAVCGRGRRPTIVAGGWGQETGWLERRELLIRGRAAGMTGL